MKSKKLLIVCLIIIILASTITNIYILSNKDNEEKTNNGITTVDNLDVLKDTTVNDLDITNVSLLTKGGMSSYKAVVTNNTQNEVNIDKLYVEFYKEGTNSKILALSNVKLQPNEQTNIKITTETDFSKVTEIKYTIEENNQTE